MRCEGHIFSRQGMTAAGVSPKAARMVFIQSPLLKEHLAFGIYDEYGKCAMQQSFLMCLKLFHGSNGFIPFVHQYDGY